MKSKKTVVIGISGGIAVYKICDVVSRLKKLGIDVYTVMTNSATKFVQPLTFQTLCQNYVVSDMFEDPKTWDVEHISLAKKADVFLIAPATANIIGKIANGIADDMLTTTVMATKAKVVIAPAMNTNMYLNKIVQRNISILKDLGYDFIEPESGRLACGDYGTGKLASPEKIVEVVVEQLKNLESQKQNLNLSNDLSGVKILVTAGPTVERIDPVRFLSNRSTGKMGYAIARQAVSRGAEVTLISGPTHIAEPYGLNKFIKITSAEELYNEVMNNLDEHKVVIQTAAVADYKPESYSDKKIKKGDDDLVITLARNKDIALEVGKVKQDKILVAFAAESNDLIENAKRKIEKKNLDFIVANDIMQKGAGFAGDTNIIKIIDNKGEIVQYPIMSKDDTANIILDEISKKLN